MIQLTDSLFAVEVPDEAKSFRIVHYTVAGTYVMQTDSKELNAWKVKIPKGSYTILGTIKHGKPDFEVERYVICVGEYKGQLWYLDYSKDAEEEDCCADSKEASFLSLLTSKNIDTKKHWLILKTI